MLCVVCVCVCVCFFQAEDGIRDLVRSRGLGDVYKRQPLGDGTYAVTGQKIFITWGDSDAHENVSHLVLARLPDGGAGTKGCLLYTSDAADERSSVDLGGRRIIQKKTTQHSQRERIPSNKRRNRETMNRHTDSK